MPYNVTLDDISPLIQYSPNWVDAFESQYDPSFKLYLGSSFHASNTAGDQATLWFRGTALFIYGAKRQNHGSYTVQMDDEPPEEYDGHATTDQFQVMIYNRTGLANKSHKVVLVNNGAGATPYVDIDFLTWTSQDETSGNHTIDDVEFTYEPQGAWDTETSVTPNYHDGTEQTDASASLTFDGTGIYLFGGTVNDHGAFTVELDNQTRVALNGSTVGYHDHVLLYYVDGLENGPHSLKVTNTDTQIKFLDIDYAEVVKPPATSSSATSASSFPTTSSTPDALPSSITSSKTPTIVGAVCGALFVLAMAATVLWYFMRRGKNEPAFPDLINCEYKPNDTWPATGYGAAGGPGWAGTHNLHYVDPWTNPAPQVGPYTYAGTEGGSTHLATIATRSSNSRRSSSSSLTSLLNMGSNVTAPIPARSGKGRPVVVPSTGVRGRRSNNELRETRIQVPGRSQDWGEVDSVRTTEMLPPDYRQATELFAPPR